MCQLPNIISIGSAVFAYTTTETPHAFQWGAQHPKIAPSSPEIWTPI